jgi:hypothetical protein
MKERWLKMSLEEIPKISLVDAKHVFKKSLVVPVIELLEREIHTAVSLTKAVGVMLPVQEMQAFPHSRNMGYGTCRSRGDIP